MLEWLRRLLFMGMGIDRQRFLFAVQSNLPAGIFALVRITRFAGTSASNVMEVKLVYGGLSVEDLAPGFVSILLQALKDGADVSVITSVPPSSLGIYQQ